MDRAVFETIFVHKDARPLPAKHEDPWYYAKPNGRYLVQNSGVNVSEIA